MWACIKCGGANVGEPTKDAVCRGCGAAPIDIQISESKEKIEQQHQAFVAQVEQQERKRAEEISFLKENGHEGYYEYKVITVNDTNGGGTDVYALSAELNELGRMGWHLRSAYTNELGVNSASVGGFGVNSTMDQHVLILERFIKFKDEIQGE